MFREATSFDPSDFNCLPSIEAADTEMRAQNRLGVALSLLEPIFLKHEMQSAWGICLLHKHWFVDEGEFPITDVKRTDIPREYELRPRQSFCKPFQPSILAVRQDSASILTPMEFSVTGDVEASVNQLG